MFRRIAFLLLLVAVVLDVSGCSGGRSARRRRATPVAFEKWTEYKAPDSTFTVFFPTAPKVDEKKTQTTVSKIYFSRNKSEAYHISVSNATDEAVAERRDKDANLLTRRADVYSKQQKETRVYGETAREMTWEKDGYNYRGIVFKTHEGHHVYTLWARWKGATEPTNVGKFFGSFKTGAYTPKPKPTVTPSASPTPDDEESASPSASASPEDGEKDATIDTKDDKEDEEEKE